MLWQCLKLLVSQQFILHLKNNMKKAYMQFQSKPSETYLFKLEKNIQYIQLQISKPQKKIYLIYSYPINQPALPSHVRLPTIQSSPSPHLTVLHFFSFFLGHGLFLVYTHDHSEKDSLSRPIVFETLFIGDECCMNSFYLSANDGEIHVSKAQ